MVELPQNQEEFLNLIRVDYPEEDNTILIATLEGLSDYLKADRSNTGLDDTIEEIFPNYDILFHAYSSLVHFYFICLNKEYPELNENILTIMEHMKSKLNLYRKYE